MAIERIVPPFKTDFDSQPDHPNTRLYRELIQTTLLQILPEEYFRLETQDHQLQYLRSLLPLMTGFICQTAPGNMSFFSIFKYRENAFKFIFEMISRWLVPGKRLNVLAVYAVDFSFPTLSNDIYTLFEIMISVENKEDLEQIQRNLPIIESEISLGVVSSYYGRRILEVKGISNDEKTTMIQEQIANVIKRQPQTISHDAFTEMQHVLVMCRDDFKAARDVRHLSRIICVQYLFRQTLRREIKKGTKKRHLYTKLFRALLRESGSIKPVLGIVVAINFLKDKEALEERHLLNAIQRHIPGVRGVQNSYYLNRRGTEPICTLYLEIEKENGQQFTKDEIRFLRQKLPSDLEGHIEHFMHPVFMPRNEEEIMRNILALSSQIRYLRDIPQMFISFDEQSHLHLFFTVILVRIKKGNEPSIEELFKKSNTFLEYRHDRCKVIGFLKKKYQKEATVFIAKMPKEKFLRQDHSIDLNKARQTVAIEISSVLGDVRDYNGGMISKQNELLCAVRNLIKEGVKYDEILLENFFYSLNPVIMRTVLEPEALKKLFLMLLQCISDEVFKKETYAIRIRAEPAFVFLLIVAEDKQIEEQINQALKPLALASTALASSFVFVSNIPYLGYIYRCDDPLKQRQFCITVQHALGVCESHV